MSAERVVRIVACHSHYLFGGEKEWEAVRQTDSQYGGGIAYYLFWKHLSIMIDKAKRGRSETRKCYSCVTSVIL
jgi:hypothetical protein